MKDYSQYGEGEFLWEYFGKRTYPGGHLVDVGAKGSQGSNTYGLIEGGGWEALMFEPLPEYFKSLVDDFEKYPGVYLIDAAVSDVEGVGKFYIHDIKDHSSLVRKSDNSIKVDIVRLPEVLKEYEYPYEFDLLSVDAEGVDGAIIRNLLSTSVYRPRLIVFEKSGEVDRGLLSYCRYKQIHETKANCIYERQG